MKKLLFLLLVSACSTSIYSQEEIRQNIISYTDSTELIIRNGRQLIVDNTIAGNHKEVNTTLNYLKEHVDKRYVILYPVEELLVSLSTRNFPLFLYNARNFSSLLEGKTKVVFNQNMLFELQEYLMNEMTFITEELDQANLSESEKEVIRLYIRYYMNDNFEKLNRSLRQYLNDHPGSEYSDFLHEIKSLTTTARFNFVLGYGNEILEGAIAETFTNRIHVMNMEIEGFINKLYLSLFIGGNISRIDSELDLPVKDKDLIHDKEEKVSNLKYGFKVGRTLFSNSHIQIYPYLTIGGYEMNSQSKDFNTTDSDNPKNNLTGSFMAGFGAAGEIVLKRWTSFSSYNSSNYVFIRPQAGYDRFLSRKAHTNGSDIYFMISLGLSMGGIY